MLNNLVNARIAGSLFPEREWEGKIFSIHDHVVNIIHPDNYLISVVENTKDLTDLSFMPPDFKLFKKLISSGRTKTVLYKKNIFKVGSYRISIENAERWNGRITESAYNLDNQFKYLQKNYYDNSADEGLSSIITGKKKDRFSSSASEKLRNIRGNYTADISFLVGLGVGFTPSGDDFITGVLLYDRLFPKKIKLDKESIQSKISKTTSGGKTLLMLALKGSFPNYLKSFSEKFLETAELDPEQYKDKIEEYLFDVLAHGSTSGSDSIAGFIWAYNL